MIETAENMLYYTYTSDGTKQVMTHDRWMFISSAARARLEPHVTKVWGCMARREVPNDTGWTFRRFSPWVPCPREFHESQSKLDPAGWWDRRYDPRRYYSEDRGERRNASTRLGPNGCHQRCF